MKIAFIVTRMDEYGGAQVHVRDLCLWLKGQGHQPVLLSGWPGKVSDALQAEGVEFIEIPDLQRSIDPIKDIKAFWQIATTLKQIKPDLVTCHSSKAGLLGRFAAKWAGFPVIFTAHGWAFTVGVSRSARILYWGLEKLSTYFSDHIITVSEFDRELAIRSHLISAQKITAIHNGMPMVPPVDRPPNLTAPIKMIMVARFGAQKDHRGLLMALSACLDLDWTLDLIGGGDDLEMRKLCTELGLEDRVNFMGERSDVDRLLTQSDLFLLISNWEGLPLSILEAMRAGLPVLASDVGGVREAVAHGQTGWLVPADAQEQLVAALRTLLIDRQCLVQMGQAGRHRFEQQFTFLNMAQKTLAVYRDVVHED